MLNNSILALRFTERKDRSLHGRAFVSSRIEAIALVHVNRLALLMQSFVLRQGFGVLADFCASTLLTILCDHGQITGFLSAVASAFVRPERRSIPADFPA